MDATTHVGVDVGGTFTDVVLATEDGLTTAKVPSTTDQSEGVLAGIEKVCEKAALPPESVETFTHAMTVSVNALLEGDGATTALVTTEGFRDVLEIGRQDRPSLYDLSVERVDPLVPRRRRFELEERATTEGIVDPVALEDVDDLVDRLAGAEIEDESEIESVAVSFLHAYADPANEAAVADRLRERLEVPVSASHEVLPAFREYERTSTTVANASVRPAIDTYLGRLVERARDAGLPEPQVMQSNGGIADLDAVRERAVTTVLSGPAAGVVGAAATAEAAVEDAGLEGLVTFDMGGTSSDVSLVRDGEVARTTSTTIAGHPIATPMVDVTTVGSGGGSIAWVDAGGALRVGPESAGADPGPACYNRGGAEPTVTDAAVVLGYLGQDASLGGEVSLDVGAAQDALAKLANVAGLESACEAAAGVYRVANATMTRAIRSVTVERGHDPREFGLVAFGGAGPMHAAAVANRLGMDRVVIPLAGGVLSAYGLLDADEKHDRVRTHRTPLEAADREVMEETYAELTADALQDVDSGGDPVVERRADLRYAGQSFELEVSVSDPVDIATVRERFDAAHERAYGYRMDEPIELVALGVTVRAIREAPSIRYEGRGEGRDERDDEDAPGSRTAFFDGERREAAVLARDAVAPGTTVEGPTILEDEESTTVVPPGWSGSMGDDGELVLERDRGPGQETGTNGGERP
ncbi:hydantoinase/oxoprolinase family protein [Natronosalvus halobius]|uniref:hydantoinase/oxoprolinase family protein n=1 Tax=Natronosalvus halobius TaxID=2953746 RepID=UPI00209D96F2|nr:hydantoinase/oxoprolinase family protein [Natronosalvus halobius]USZ71173.1 hydantoinase/oxoprolinase family protein [Natronosalvus halobius]